MLQVKEYYDALDKHGVAGQKNLLKRQLISEFIKGGNSFETAFFENLKSVVSEKNVLMLCLLATQ